MKLTRAGILVSPGMKVLQAAPPTYPYLSAAQTMNIQWVRFHLGEAHEELTRVICQLQQATEPNEAEFEVAIGHIYNHLNTAWNSREANDDRISQQTDDDFYAWRAFPKDIQMGRQ